MCRQLRRILKNYVLMAYIVPMCASVEFFLAAINCRTLVFAHSLSASLFSCVRALQVFFLRRLHSLSPVAPPLREWRQRGVENIYTALTILMCRPRMPHSIIRCINIRRAEHALQPRGVYWVWHIDDDGSMAPWDAVIFLEMFTQAYHQE